MNEKKSAQKVWSKDLIYDGNFRFSSKHTNKLNFYFVRNNTKHKAC